MSCISIRAKIEKAFSSLITERNQFIPGITGSESGHAAGTPTESWVKDALNDMGINVFYPHEFLKDFFDNIDNIGKDKLRVLNRIRISKALTNVWWGSLLATKKQIESYIANGEVKPWQQCGADLIILDGKDIEDIILVNVKSHNSTKESRAPNIMSAQRLLEELHALSIKKGASKLNKANIWFIGVTYSPDGTNGKIVNVTVKDLFKLDVSRIPQINFDAAIQIQWHVEDMVEKKQTKEEFTKELANSFLQQWKRHSIYKDKKYIQLVKEINDSL